MRLRVDGNADDRVRLRTDNWHDAGRWRAILLHAVPDPRIPSNVKWSQGWPEWHDTHEEAKLGDVWRIRQRPFGPTIGLTETERQPTWWTVGYALVCPVESCHEGVHSWVHAHNCPAGSTWGAQCKRGPERRSCWDWSGSVEAGDLTAAPSLQVLPCPDAAGNPTTCAFHGFLTRGVIA